MTYRHLCGAAALFGCLAAALAGCGSRGDQNASPAAPSASASPRAAATGPSQQTNSTGPAQSSPTSGGSVATTPVATVSVKVADMGPLAMGDYNGGTILAPVSRSLSGRWDTVEAITIGSKTTKDVAHTAWATGLINWVATTGDWIAWTDQSSKQGDGAIEVLWQVHARNLRTGQNRILASSGDKPNPFVPVIQAQDGYFFWTEPESDRSAQELLWKPGQERPHALLRHAEMTPGSASIAAGKLIYLGPNGRGLEGHTTGGDCWEVPLTGGNPTPATHTALAMGCAARGDHVAWSQHIDPDTPTPPADGIYDDPYSLWSVDLSSTATPVELHEGYNATFQPRLTDKALVWQEQSDKAFVTGLDGQSTRAPLAKKAPRRMVSGPDDLFAYATGSGSGFAVTVVKLA